MSEFLHAVSTSLQSLISSKVLVVEESTFDANAFGNAVVLLRGQNLRVRFIRDRSQVFVELACPGLPDDWHSLQRVLNAMGLLGPPEGPIDVSVAADLLARHVQRLEHGMCSKQTKDRLAELESAAKRDLLQRLRGRTN